MKKIFIWDALITNRQSRRGAAGPGLLRKLIILWMLLGWWQLTPLPAQIVTSAPIRVACVGASTTYGATLENRAVESFPAQLQKLLGTAAWDVQNFGVNGAGVLHEGEIPYCKTPAYRAAVAFLPDIVVLNLGVNDVKPENWKYKADFIKNYQQLIADFKKSSAHPKFYICREVPVFVDRWGIRAQVVLKELYPLKKEIATQANLLIIDLYTPLLGKGCLFPDGIHPNKEATAIVAKIIAHSLIGHTSGSFP